MFYRRFGGARGQRGFVSFSTIILGVVLAVGWYHFIYKGSNPGAAASSARAAADGAIAKAGNAVAQGGAKASDAGTSVGGAVSGAGHAVASIPAKIGNAVKNMVGGSGASGAPNLVVTSGSRNTNWMAMSKTLPPLEGNANETRQSHPASDTAQCEVKDNEGHVGSTPCKCYMVVDAAGNDPDAPPVYHCAALSMASAHN